MTLTARYGSPWAALSAGDGQIVSSSATDTGTWRGSTTVAWRTASGGLSHAGSAAGNDVPTHPALRERRTLLAILLRPLWTSLRPRLPRYAGQHRPGPDRVAASVLTWAMWQARQFRAIVASVEPDAPAWVRAAPADGAVWAPTYPVEEGDVGWFALGSREVRPHHPAGWGYDRG